MSGDLIIGLIGADSFDTDRIGSDILIIARSSGVVNLGLEYELDKNNRTQHKMNMAALSYYRYERIVTDIATCAEQIFGMQGNVEERRKGLGIMNQFLPNNVVDIAHRTYDQL